jgi:GT2 family glycosyltransferase
VIADTPFFAKWMKERLLIDCEVSRSKPDDLLESISVGAVIIGRNEGARLVSCLDALQSSAFSCVYVDSASSDNSVAEARQRGIEVIALDLSVPFTAARARNAGFASLEKLWPDIKYVQFIDGDCELDAGWMATAINYLEQKPEIAAVCGRRKERYPERSSYNALCDDEWNTPIGEAEAFGGDALVRKAAFISVGGYDDAMIAGEEPELCWRLRHAGWRIWRLDASMTLHDAAMYHFRQYWVRSLRSGFGYMQVYWKCRTVSGATPLYGRQILRAIFWAGLLPLVVAVSAILTPYALVALPAIYLVQIARMASRSGVTSGISWQYAALQQISKFAELLGIFKFVWRKWILRQTGGAIIYK